MVRPNIICDSSREVIVKVIYGAKVVYFTVNNIMLRIGCERFAFYFFHNSAKVFGHQNFLTGVKIVGNDDVVRFRSDLALLIDNTVVNTEACVLDESYARIYNDVPG